MNKLKRWVSTKSGKRVLAIIGTMLVMCSMAVPAFAVEEGAAGFDGAAAIAGARNIFGQATSTLSIANIVAIIGICIGAAVGLYLLWWGLRKVLKVIKAAFSKGKVTV